MTWKFLLTIVVACNNANCATSFVGTYRYTPFWWAELLPEADSFRGHRAYIDTSLRISIDSSATRNVI
jgi:hypothetical protein